jgi:hypothetical protein
VHRCDPGSHGVARDTENPDNVPLYRRLGFVVTATVELDGARATAMFGPHAGRAATPEG